MRKLGLIAAFITLLILSSAELFGAPGVQAQLGGGYDLTWNAIGGGGGASTGGAYALDGTIGQPDVGSMNGGAYTLTGGFWVSLDILGIKINLPLIVR